MATPTDPAPSRGVWYFGYGSNMDRGTFLGRRRMRPLETRVGTVFGWRLCFDLPVGRGERGVANIRPAGGECLWGVLWRITPLDLARLDRTEGVHRGVYVRQPVEVVEPSGERVAALTYRSHRGRPGRKPSRRYMGLLLAGARDHGLPAEYVAWLRRFELAVDERERHPARLF